MKKDPQLILLEAVGSEYFSPSFDQALLAGAMALSNANRISEAMKNFQVDGVFSSVLRWGDNILPLSYEKMLKFCLAHKEEFLREAR